MDADLKALEEKLGQLIELCQSLRAENTDLRQQLAQTQDKVKLLKEHIQVADSRLEAIIERLPQEVKAVL